jgi:2-iminobutanoate/2-iminopropanoate deaminase
MRGGFSRSIAKPPLHFIATVDEDIISASRSNDLLRNSAPTFYHDGGTSVSQTSIQTEKAPAAIGPYSQAMVANGFLFTAGQIALDPASGQIIAGDVVAQAERVLANLKAILDAAGATWNDVVKTTVYLHDMNDFPRVNEVYAKALGLARPARSTVQVSALPRGVLVEIDAIVAVR